MSHHRDANVPQRLSATALAEFEKQEDVININQEISSLTKKIGGNPAQHEGLSIERAKLYNKKAKLRHSWRTEFVKEWWSASYSQYVAGDDISDRDTTNLFDIYKKYLPERTRLSKNIFKDASIDSVDG